MVIQRFCYPSHSSMGVQDMSVQPKWLVMFPLICLRLSSAAFTLTFGACVNEAAARGPAIPETSGVGEVTQQFPRCIFNSLVSSVRNCLIQVK